MAKSVDEVIAEITAAKKTDKDGNESTAYNRFSKKNFNSLLKAIVNDPEYKFMTVTVKGDNTTPEGIDVTKQFRDFLYKILVKAGVDSSDAKAIYSENFTIDSVDGMYELLTATMYQYMAAGNKFDMIPTEDFKASLYIEDMPETKEVGESKNPFNGESLGVFETTKKAYKRLRVKSSCPAWLVSRQKQN